MSKINHNNHFYDGMPINQVDFKAEFDKEMKELENHLKGLQSRAYSSDTDTFNYEYWTYKISRANKALEVGQVTLD